MSDPLNFFKFVVLLLNVLSIAVAITILADPSFLSYFDHRGMLVPAVGIMILNAVYAIIKIAKDILQSHKKTSA